MAMAKFLFVYTGGAMETDPKKAQASMAAWTKWFQDMGKAVVDMGAQTKPGKVVSKSGVKTGVTGEPVTGYSVISADNLDAAVTLAKKSPQTSGSGQIAVYEILPM
jgi:hypothetical protein